MPTPSTQQGASVEIATPSPGLARLVLAGRFDSEALAAHWDPTMRGIRELDCTELEADLTGITFCDSAGLTLLIEAREIIQQRGIELSVVGTPEHLRPLLKMLSPERTPKSKPASMVSRPTSLPIEVGRATESLFREIHAQIAFVGEIVAALLAVVRRPKLLRLGDALLVAEKAGVNAVPVVALIGGLVGLIIAFQGAPVMRQYGADVLIPNLIGVAMVRELGPLMTAIILAGRSGSAFAAELGTMKVTEELNALSTFGLDPVRFLVVPRVLAALIVTPMLSVVCSLVGVLGGYPVMASLGYSFSFYMNAVEYSVQSGDLIQGTFKAAIFALLVAAIGCLRGLRTASGPRAVGDSTTRAVVAGIVLIVIADGAMGVVFYSLGF